MWRGWEIALMLSFFSSTDESPKVKLLRRNILELHQKLECEYWTVKLKGNYFVTELFLLICSVGAPIQMFGCKNPCSSFGGGGSRFLSFGHAVKIICDRFCIISKNNSTNLVFLTIVWAVTLVWMNLYCGSTPVSVCKRWASGTLFLLFVLAMTVKMTKRD